MNERALHKKLLVERVRNSRETLGLEIDALRGRFDGASNVLRIAAKTLPQVGTAAATAAGAAKVGKAGAGGALGLAALAPIIIAVAKIVIERNRRRAQVTDGGEPPEEPAPSENGVEAKGD